ncbi:MAG: CBS domain-containing protein, partial [Desulfobacterales bacterium]
AVSNTPISTIIIVSEMTNSYHLLLPSILVCSVTYMASRPWTIFNSQVKNKLESPAHAGDFFVDVLESFKVSDLIHAIKSVRVIPQNMLLIDFKQCFGEMTQHYFPVADERGRMIGIFSINDVRGVLFAPEVEHLVIMKDIATHDIITTDPTEDLHSVLNKFTIKNIDSLPVVSKDDPARLMGMLNRREVIAFYNQKIQEKKSSRSEE